MSESRSGFVMGFVCKNSIDKVLTLTLTSESRSGFVIGFVCMNSIDKVLTLTAD